MSIINRMIVMLATTFAATMLFAAPASAQTLRAWVSGVGDDINPCSRTAPCKTFQGALSRTGVGGEINCLDPGGFGAVTITQSVSIICDGIQQAGILTSGANGVTINVPPGSFVTLSGLFIDGSRNTGFSPGTNGVSIIQGGTVSIRNSTITGFGDTSGSGFGVNFVPTAAATLVLSNVTLTENGNNANATSGGLRASPAAGVTATVTINNSRIQNNANVGVRFDTIGIVGSVIEATIANSVISGDGSGLLSKAPAGTGTVKVMISGSTLSENSGYGLTANGTGTTIHVGKSEITNNGTGLLALLGAVLASYGTNQFDGNGTDGAFTGTVLPNK